MILCTTLLVLLSIFIFLFYKYTTRNFKYWKERGIPYAEPIPLFGNFLKVLTFRTHVGHYLADLYNQLDSPFFGVYILDKPHLIIKDPELIKSVLMKDFNYFTDRVGVSDEQCDSISANFLFFSKNPEWRKMRSKVTPIFSSGKIKNMLALMNVVGEEMKSYIEKTSHKNSIEAKEVCAKYSTDVIASCAFGIEAHCFQYENAEFRKMGKKIFSLDLITSVKQACYFILPSAVKLFKLSFLDTRVKNFMRDVFWRTLKERRKYNTKRNDVIDIINNIMETQQMKDDIFFKGDRVVAQTSQFYVAGFETVSATMAFALYELCLNEEIQTKVRSEIKTILNQYGSLTYEAQHDMKYLQMVINETLRKYPVLPFLDRMCLEDYKVPGTDFIIEKGTPIFIPMFGLHYDSKYFPKPYEFIPERFADDCDDITYGFTFIPFGKGPRNCIGERFGLLATKLGLAHILSEFTVERSEDTPVPIKYFTKGFLLASTVGLPMKFRKVE